MELIKSLQSGLQSLLGIKAIQNKLTGITLQTYNQIYPSWHSWKVIKAYKTLDDIFSVVTKLSNKAASVPIFGYNDKMEDLPETDKLVIFLRSLTFTQRVELFTWLYLRGEVVIYKEKSLGVNGFVESICFINPSWITIVLTDTWPEQIAQYWFRDPTRGIDTMLEVDEVVFIKNFNPSDDYRDGWRGYAPVDALTKRLERMDSNMNNSVAQMQNGGVPGVMYFKDIPNTAQGKQAIDQAKENVVRYFTNSSNKGAPMVQAGEMGYFNIGSNLVDMDSIELEKIDFKKICNAFSTFDILFGSDSASTESNVKEVRQMNWTDAIIPKLQMVEDAFNQDLVNDFGSGFRQVKFDLGSVKDLQQNQLDLANALSASPVMIPNDVLEAMGYDRVNNPDMDLPLIKSGYEPIDNFQPLPPIE